LGIFQSKTSLPSCIFKEWEDKKINSIFMKNSLRQIKNIKYSSLNSKIDYMKSIPILLIIFIAQFTFAQHSIPLPMTPAEGITWQGPEKSYFSEIWQTEVITNVSVPTLEAFLAPDSLNTGTSVIIAPGGGLYAHSIESEGNMVARWLNKKGINAFVLKYRLVPTGKDGVAEINNPEVRGKADFWPRIHQVIKLSVADGLNAIAYLKRHAQELNINPTNIGFMGFSAGGAVTMGVAYSATEATQPNFLVAVYPWANAMPVQTPKDNAPPLLVICAADDPIDLAPPAIDLYNAWYQKKRPVGLHMYSQGGHGFGMRKQGLPSDQWIQRFYEWSVAEGFVKDYN